MKARKQAFSRIYRAQNQTPVIIHRHGFNYQISQAQRRLTLKLVYPSTIELLEQNKLLLRLPIPPLHSSLGKLNLPDCIAFSLQKKPYTLLWQKKQVLLMQKDDRLAYLQPYSWYCSANLEYDDSMELIFVAALCVMLEILLRQTEQSLV